MARPTGLLPGRQVAAVIGHSFAVIRPLSVVLCGHICALCSESGREASPPFKVLRKISELHASSPRAGDASGLRLRFLRSFRDEKLGVSGGNRQKKPGTGSRADVPGERGQNSGTPVVVHERSCSEQRPEPQKCPELSTSGRTNDCPGLWRCERGTVSSDSVRENHGRFVRVWNLSRHLVRGRRGPSLVPAYLRGTSTERSQEFSTHERTRSFPAG